MKTFCKYCQAETNHTSIMCFNKPRRPIRQVSKKTLRKEQETKRLWFENNPPDSKGVWLCYLRISPWCPVKLTRSTIELDHVKPRSGNPHLKYDITNLRPACTYCNQLKGSRSLESILNKDKNIMKIFKNAWFWFGVFCIVLFFVTYFGVRLGTEKIMSTYEPPKELDYRVVN